MRNNREKYLSFFKDVNLYIKHKFGIENITNDYSFYKKYCHVKNNKEKMDEFVIIESFLKWNGIIINKETIKWFISLAKEFYGIEVEYNKFLLNLVGVNPVLYNNAPRRWFRHRVETPFRERQKFIKNKAKIKNKELSEHEKRKKDFKEFISGPTDNQKRHRNGYKNWDCRRGNRSLRRKAREAREAISQDDYDNMPTIDLETDPWGWN